MVRRHPREAPAAEVAVRLRAVVEEENARAVAQGYKTMDDYNSNLRRQARKVRSTTKPQPQDPITSSVAPM